MARATSTAATTSSRASADGAFVHFLAKLPAEALDDLYARSPWASLAVLRALDSVAKQIALRLIYVDGGCEETSLWRWCEEDGRARGATAAALARLARLRAVFVVEGGEGEEARFVAHESFAKNIRRALERGFVGLEGEDGGGEDAAATEADVVAKVPDRTTLNAYAKSKWEDLLLTLTGASDAFTRPGSKVSGRLDAQALFRAAGLTTATTSALKKGGQKRLKNAGVTAAGFRFLLTTAQEQTWVLLTQYISDSQKESSTSAISFLLRLTFQQPGRAYAVTDVLSDMEQDVVRDLTHLGLLYTFEHKKRWYYVPTLLSSGLSGGFSGDDGETKTVAAEGHVIVETNYRVYAYTSSLVEMEILRLFTRADYRLPNLYVGMLTRESVQNALRAGVDAEQIVAYLRAHAHKQARAKKPSVPGTVSDQIRLWARDMHRVDAEECVLYCDFPVSGGFYDAVVAEAVKRDALAWRDDASRRLAVRAWAHEAMKPAVAVLKQTLGDSAI